MCSAGNKARSTNQMARFSSSEPLGAEKEKKIIEEIVSQRFFKNTEAKGTRKCPLSILLVYIQAKDKCGSLVT
jgi:hypothetical protein